MIRIIELGNLLHLYTYTSRASLTVRVTSFPEVRIGKETEIGLIQVIIHSFIEHINICDTSYMRVCSLQPALQVDNAGVSQLGAPACGIVYKCSNLPGCLWAS